MPKATEQLSKIVSFRPAPSLADMADELGALQAALKPMQAREKALKEKLKAAGQASIVGERFVVEISHRAGADRLDMSKAVADYGREFLLKGGYLIPGGMQDVLTSKPLAVLPIAVAAE